jgi:hypothetical protein
VKKILIAILLGGTAACAVVRADAQEALWEQIQNQNARMTAFQPTWMAPLVQSDSRLGQAVRVSVAQSTAPGERTVSYGNNHGIDLIAGTRWQLEAVPPSFFRNHSRAFPDGWGNALAEVKYRLASGNAEHGNFALTAILVEGFSPRAYENHALTGSWVPKLAAGKAFGNFNVQTTVDGVLPTGKVEVQGRAVDWNVTGQAHASARTWFDVEDNATFVLGGPYDGKTQNFVTPAGFLLVREDEWGFRHPAAVIDGGMQIATSTFHFCDHKVITEIRILF